MSDLQIFLILSGIVLITLLTGYVLFTPRKQPVLQMANQRHR